MSNTQYLPIAVIAIFALIEFVGLQRKITSQRGKGVAITPAESRNS
jgi:hypothetical protein